ncbi:sal-like protein 1 [Nephila pilipes]|uniref:Sal-like protein 1 n=1 Tax=Nephila pilipes TaxID=299642 RepID=A0A8X6NNK0_NEPPI|nr:sal-like protein 1 [Nephila pilipes]
MPRRKQQRPKHLENPEELASSLQNGFGSGSSSETEGDEHVCGKCRAEFPTLSDFLLHKKSCVSKRPVLVAPLDVAIDTDEDDEDNESSEYDAIPFDNTELPFSTLHEWLQTNSQVQSMLLDPRGPNTNVTIAHLENTSVAVAQLAPSGAPLNDLVSTLHQNQIEQLEILRVIAKIVQAKDLSGNAPPLIGAAALTPFRTVNNIQAAGSASNSVSAACATPAYPQGGRMQESPLSSQPPTEDSLALLQKHTERYIQDSMSRKSFLNGMDDDSRYQVNYDSYEQLKSAFLENEVPATDFKPTVKDLRLSEEIRSGRCVQFRIL